MQWTVPLTSEGVGPHGEEGQGEGQVPHTWVGLEQGHQGQQYVGKEHWLVTAMVGTGDEVRVHPVTDLNLTERGRT